MKCCLGPFYIKNMKELRESQSYVCMFNYMRHVYFGDTVLEKAIKTFIERENEYKYQYKV